MQVFIPERLIPPDVPVSSPGGATGVTVALFLCLNHLREQPTFYLTGAASITSGRARSKFFSLLQSAGLPAVPPVLSSPRPVGVGPEPADPAGSALRPGYRLRLFGMPAGEGQSTVEPAGIVGSADWRSCLTFSPLKPPRLPAQSRPAAPGALPVRLRVSGPHLAP